MADEAIAVGVPDPAKMAWYELNDLGNARRLRDLARGQLLFVEDHWTGFDGQRWSAEDGAMLAQRLAHDMARHIAVEADALAETLDTARDAAERERIEERLSNLYKHAVSSGNANKTTAALQQAKSDLAARRDDFDPETLALNMANGTLRFLSVDRANGGAGRATMPPVSGWTVRLDPHDPHDRISRVAGVAWNPEAACPEWERHLATVLPDPAVRRFFQACVGYAATGEIREQCVLLLQGRGGDGKSTTMDVIREVLGGYAKTAAVESFLHGNTRSGAEASPDMARLSGDTRLVCTSEPRIGAMLDEGRIKQVTGGQPVPARELHGALFEYVPKWLLVLECNRKPRISGDDDGIWRRVIVIHFPHQFKGDEADKGVQRRLLGEAEGVLRWIVEGTLIWLSEGLVAPDPVREAIDDYRRASNPFGEWFATFVDVRDPKARERSADLYASYKAFCEDNAVSDRETMSSTAFGRALGDKQLMKAQDSAGKIIRKGCRLRSRDELNLPEPEGEPGWDDQAGTIPDSWGPVDPGALD